MKKSLSLYFTILMHILVLSYTPIRRALFPLAYSIHYLVNYLVSLVLVFLRML